MDYSLPTPPPFPGTVGLLGQSRFQCCPPQNLHGQGGALPCCSGPLLLPVSPARGAGASPCLCRVPLRTSPRVGVPPAGSNTLAIRRSSLNVVGRWRRICVRKQSRVNPAMIPTSSASERPVFTRRAIWFLRNTNSGNDWFGAWRMDTTSARSWDRISSLSKYSRNSVRNSSQGRSSTLTEFHQDSAVPFNCGSIALHQPAGCICACTRIDSALSRNLTGSSALVPVNSGNEALAARSSPYGISTDRSCPRFALNDD